MEAVKAFNDELFSVQETKGPISRAKMAKITAIAIKTVKFYKHVVHSVEKFIQKSDVEHKIPGLYVMDSIIRQSIHRFGVERDVFASRFAKNIFGTFQHLLQCKEDEKVKIVRVLQLWQKNSVFSNDLIQKLLDVIEKSSEGTTHSDETSNVDMSLASNDSEALQETGSQQLDSSQILNNVCQMLQSDKATQINQLLQQVANNHPQLLPQLSQIIQLSQNQNTSTDGDHPDDSDKIQPSEQSSSKPNEMPGNASDFSSGDFKGSSRVANWQLEAKSGFSDSSKGHGWTSEYSGVQHGNAEAGSNAFGNYHLFQSSRSQQQPQRSQHRVENDDSFVEREEGETWDDEEMSHYPHHGAHEMDYNYNNKHQWSDRHNDDRHFPRKRRRSGDRGSNERSQRSRSREKRRRSRSREKSYRSDSRERHEGRQKKETERKHGLPTSKPEHALICSTTLWIGHLNKHTTEQELKMELSNYGNVTSLNLIPPRGCAFVTFSARTEAQKALERVKGKKFNNNVLKVAWAIGSGMKESELKEFWDLEQGLSFIPWSRLDADTDLDALAEGGILDEESLPQDLLKALKEKRDSDLAEDDLVEPGETINNNNTDKFNNCQARPMPNVAPPCFPHLPLPLPGMPPLLPPPPGLMVGIPPPMIPPAAPMAMMSPSQGNRSEGTTPTSTGTPGKPHPEVHVPPPSFPPPPLPGWNGPGIGPLPPPMPFPPPPVPMRPMPPPQTLPPNFEPEANANESLELDVEPDFNSHQVQKSFRGHLRPPPLRSPGPWAFNNRGGPRPPPPHRHHPRDEEFYRDGPHDGGRPFPPNRFSPRFRPDHYQQQHQSRGRGNWDRGGFRKNFRNWGENNTGEDQREEFCPEGERYFDQHRGDDWDREHRDFQRHQDMRWNNRRNNRWEDHGRGFGRGRPRWQQGEREDPRWSRGNRGNHNQPWDEGRRHQRQYHEVDEFKSNEDAYPDMLERSMDASTSENWREADEYNKSQKDESMSMECAKEQPAPSLDTQDKKRVKKSRWDAGDDQPETAVDVADGRCDV